MKKSYDEVKKMLFTFYFSFTLIFIDFCIFLSREDLHSTLVLL